METKVVSAKGRGGRNEEMVVRKYKPSVTAPVSSEDHVQHVTVVNNTVCVFEVHSESRY